MAPFLDPTNVFRSFNAFANRSVPRAERRRPDGRRAYFRAVSEVSQRCSASIISTVDKVADIHLGTDTAAGWKGRFYPESDERVDYLTVYAGQFDTVEVDSTFYAGIRRRGQSPARMKTPQGFISVKVPQAIAREGSRGSQLPTSTTS